MTVRSPASTSSGLLSSQRWVGLSILLAILVVGLLSWLHFEQRHSLQLASRQLGEIKQARIDLAKGFLAASLAEGPDIPFQRDAGRALLRQSVETFERSAAEGAGLDAQEVAEFRQSVESFRRHLEAWRQASDVQARELVALRIAFSDLERQADRLDAAGQRRIDALYANNDRIYAYSLFGSILALGLIIAILLVITRKESSALEGQYRLNLAHQDSEARFQRLFQNAPLAMSYVDQQGRVRTQNARFDKLFGYTQADLPTIADWWLLAYPDLTYRASVQASWDAAVARADALGQDIESEEYRVTCKDGSERIVLISGIRVSDGILASFFDITARRQAEERLRQSQAQMQALIRHAPISIAMFDRAMHYLAYSDRWLKDYGRGHADLAGLSHYDVHLDLPPEWIEVHQRGLAGETIKNDADMWSLADGSSQWLRWAVLPWYDEQGEIGGIIMSAEDITDSMLAAQALRDSERRYRELVQTANSAILRWSRDGTITFMNDYALSLFGWRTEEVIGQPVSILVPEQETGGGDLSTLVGDIVEHPERYRSNINENVCRDGRRVWMNWSNRAICEGQGQVTEIQSIGNNITELKHAEENIRQLNVSLERRVVERTAELTSANRELDAFAYAVSHDLRAPLRAMNGFALALVEDYGQTLDGEARTYLDQISIASRKMGDLIDGILVLSRSTRGKMRHEEVDLSELAQRVGDDLARGEPGRSVALEIEAGLTAYGDPRMIEAVLANLLGNAWKYSGRTAKPEIRVYTEERGGQRWFCVEDNGACFAMAHSERLFQPFQRLHRQDEFAGIGIGLATVQRIVHRHGGEIEARGAVGRGATFCFCLAAQGAGMPPTTDQGARP